MLRLIIPKTAGESVSCVAFSTTYVSSKLAVLSRSAFTTVFLSHTF